MRIKFNTSTIRLSMVVLIIVGLSTAAVRVQAGGSDYCKNLMSVERQLSRLSGTVGQVAHEIGKNDAPPATITKLKRYQSSIRDLAQHQRTLMKYKSCGR
jgi:phosphoribosylformylglycinamidine (FGAM) synthase-like enzyme